MSKALVVAEKPSVARDIAAALGGFENHESHLENQNFVVSWAVGHLLELKEPEEIDPKYKRWLLEDLPILPERFDWKPKEGQSERIRVLRNLSKRPDIQRVVNACDAGREGELIFRELMLHFQCPKPSWRLWLQSMTADAIREGFRNLRPGSEYDGLGDAAFCRAEADWLIGMNATRALTRRMKTRSETTAWSAGRVQTPTLALMAERELEVLNHRPEPYWRILGEFQAPSHRYPGTWFNPKFVADPDSPRKDDWILDAQELERILKAVAGQAGQAHETRKPRRESAPTLFDLTGLQREANRKFGFSARRTLQAAQRLYEQHKLLTYPRTDSRCLPNDYREHVQTVLGKFAQPGGTYAAAAQMLRQKGLQNQKKVFDDSKVSDHFAIIPTDNTPSGELGGDDQRIYDLVVRRFLAAFYPPALWIEVERITQIAQEHFRTRSRYLHDPGWYEVYGKEGEDTKLPALGALSAETEAALVRSLQGESSDSPAAAAPASSSKGVPVSNLEVHSEAEQTKPPARITEARLLSLMEHAGQQVRDDETLSEAMKGKGLGTPATRAEIIENLISKQYARRVERVLRATSKGILLIDLLRRIDVERLASARLTGELEKHLQEVEMGKRRRSEFMEEVFGDVRGMVEKTKTFSYDQLYVADPPLGSCPKCQQAEVFEQSRFYACQRNNGKEAECDFIIWKERSGRYLERRTLGELLRDGQSALLEGFLTSSGRSYSARLRLNDEFQLETVSEGGSDAGGDSIDPNAAPLAPCPLLPSGCSVYETPSNYRCLNHCIADVPKRKVGVVLPKLVCQREIQVEEALAYFLEGSTPEIGEFMSRFGRPFTARLVFQPNGRHSFEFPPREAKEGKTPAKKTTKATKATGGKKATTGKKATSAKKTTAKKTTTTQKATTAKKTKASESKAKTSKAATGESKAKRGKGKAEQLVNP